MKYFVELSSNTESVVPGRLYPIYWDIHQQVMRVDFPRGYNTLGILNNWEDETGYVVEL